MKTLLCTIPDGPVKDNDEPLIPRNGGKHFVPFPLGIVRILSYMENYGHTGDIYDINNLHRIKENSRYELTFHHLLLISCILSTMYDDNYNSYYLMSINIGFGIFLDIKGRDRYRFFFIRIFMDH